MAAFAGEPLLPLSKPPPPSLPPPPAEILNSRLGSLFRASTHATSSNPYVSLLVESTLKDDDEEIDALEPLDRKSYMRSTSDVAIDREAKAVLAAELEHRRLQDEEFVLLMCEHECSGIQNINTDVFHDRDPTCSKHLLEWPIRNASKTVDDSKTATTMKQHSRKNIKIMEKRLERMRTLQMENPHIVMLEESDSDSNSENEKGSNQSFEAKQEEYDDLVNGTRVEVNRGRGKGWELGTVQNTAVEADAAARRQRKRHLYQTMKNIGEVASGMATTVRTIANDTATVLEMAVSSAALTATLDSDTLILRQEQLAQKREVEKRRAAHAKQLKYPKKLSKNNSLHKRLDPKESSHLVAPRVLIDGWKHAYHYKHIRRRLTPEMRLAEGHAEARVAHWAPPIDLLTTPELPGERTGYSLNPNEIFVYEKWRGGEGSRGVAIRHRVYAGKSYTITFYELVDGRGWAHDHCRDQPEGCTIETLGTAEADRDGGLFAQITNDFVRATRRISSIASDTLGFRREGSDNFRSSTASSAENSNTQVHSINAQNAQKNMKINSPLYLDRLAELKRRIGKKKFKKLVWWTDATENEDDSFIIDDSSDTDDEASEEFLHQIKCEAMLTQQVKKLNTVHEPKKTVCFDTRISVVEIESWRQLPSANVIQLWSSKKEIKASKQRNIVEFESEGFDWRNALEEDSFVVHGGEKIHPIHFLTDRLQRQTMEENALIERLQYDISQTKKMIALFIGTPQHQRKTSSTASVLEFDSMPVSYWQGRFASKENEVVHAADAHVMEKYNKNIEEDTGIGDSSLEDAKFSSSSIAMTVPKSGSSNLIYDDDYFSEDEDEIEEVMYSNGHNRGASMKYFSQPLDEKNPHSLNGDIFFEADRQTARRKQRQFELDSIKRRQDKQQRQLVNNEAEEKQANFIALASKDAASIISGSTLMTDIEARRHHPEKDTLQLERDLAKLRSLARLINDL